MINHSSVSLPGIGTLQFVDIAAFTLADGHIMPPKREIKLLNNDVESISPMLIGFLSKQLDVTETQSKILFSQFLQSVKNILAEKQVLQWENVGQFKRDNVGGIQFSQVAALDIYLKPIKAERINQHNNDRYELLVGDNETTNVAIQEELDSANIKKNSWWIWAIIVAVLAATIIAIRFAG